MSMGETPSSLLAQQVRALLADAREAYAGTPQDEVLATAAATFEEPLRVAIAGRVKAGKSTLLNALIGEQVAATDAGECTRVVTWYLHGAGYRAWAHPYEGRPEAIGLRRGEGSSVLDLGGRAPESLERITVELPNARLAQLTMIDTPGIASTSVDVSRRTVEFLTSEQPDSGGADAVLYLMRHLHTSDVHFLEAFHDDDVSETMPVNAIGVLSRADEIGGGRTDAMALAQGIASRYSDDPRVRALVQTVVPVAGLLAQAGATLRQREYGALGALAGAPVEDVAELELSVDRFTASATRAPVDAVVRAELLERMGLFGVKVAVGLIRHGMAASAPDLARALTDLSGLPALRAVLVSQFTARRDVLKAHGALRTVGGVLAATPVPGSDGLRLRQEEVAASTHDLAELRLLNDLRTGDLVVGDERRVRMEVLLGVRGGSPRARLGLDASSDTEQVRAALLEQLGEGLPLAESPVATQAVRRAAGVLRRTCEGLFVDAELSGQPAL